MIHVGPFMQGLTLGQVQQNKPSTPLKTLQASARLNKAEWAQCKWLFGVGARVFVVWGFFLFSFLLNDGDVNFLTS